MEHRIANESKERSLDEEAKRMHRFGYDLHDTWSYQAKFCSTESLISFIAFTRNQNMHVDLHEHGCKDKEETEQAVTDDICREIIPWYYPLHYQFSATSCMQYHARSECFNFLNCASSIR